MEFEFLVDDKIHTISLEKKEKIFVFSDEKETYKAEIHFLSANEIFILIGEKAHKVYFAEDKEKKYFYVGGNQFIIKEPGEKEESFEKGEERDAEDKLMVKAPMPGKVIKLNVTENEEIRKNQTLAIVEAMKMENEIKSSIEGFVKKIFVSAGDLVDSEKPLIELALK